MEFGDGHVANAGSSGFIPSECVFGAGEIITQVSTDTATIGSFKFPTRLTFVTSQQTCVGGPQATGNTQTFTGERLLYVKGKIHDYFMQMYFVFSSC